MSALSRLTRRLLLLTAMVVASLGADAQHWIATTHDFGAFEENDGKVTCRFDLVNDTAEPIAVIAARPSCGCTVPTIPRRAIEPGDTAAVEVTFDPTGRPGRFEKNVKVELSSGHPRTVTLKIKGVVIGSSNTLRSRYPVDAGALKLRTRVIPFGEVSTTRSRAEFIEVYNASTDTLVPRWVNLPQYIRVSSVTDSVPPGEQIAYAMTLIPAQADTYGFVTDSVAIIASEFQEPFVLDIVANIVEDFSTLTPGQRKKAPVARLSTTSVDLGQVDNDHIAIGSFTITNAGKDIMKIRRVYTADPGVTLTVDRDKVKAGKSARVTVQVDPELLPAEIVNARIAVITNDPDNPTQYVRVVGQLK